MDYKKTILKTAVITISSLIIGVILIFLIMHFVFTSTFADFMYNVGLENYAASLYYKAYEKDGNILHCYKSLNLNISLNNYEKIVKQYEDFIGDEDLKDFLTNLKIKNEKLDISVLERSTLLNEENYLAVSYIKALVKSDMRSKAEEFALGQFKNYLQFDLENLGVYGLGVFVDNLEFFEETHEGFSDSLIVEIQEYFDNSCTEFNNNKETQDVVEKAYLVSLGNRIINVGNDLKIIYSELENDMQIQNNLNKMLEINEGIKALL